MTFDLNKSLEILERTPHVYLALLSDLEYGWDAVNEGPETWSAFDILGHLIHGENTDWIPRARLILSNAKDKTFEPFDRFAQETISEGKSIQQLLEEFKLLRDQNLKELISWQLNEDDLKKEGVHPDLGPVTLKQLIASWTIHDLSHLNQISRVMVKHYGPEVGPWKAYSRILSNPG